MSRAKTTHLPRRNRKKVILLPLGIAVLVAVLGLAYRINSPSPATVHARDKTDAQMAMEDAASTMRFLSIIGYKLETPASVDCSYGDPTIVPYSCRVSAFIIPNPNEPPSIEPSIVAKRLGSLNTALTSHGWELTSHYNDALGKLQPADWPSALAKRAVAVTYSKTYPDHSTTADLHCEVEVIINISPQSKPIGYDQDTLICTAQSNS